MPKYYISNYFEQFDHEPLILEAESEQDALEIYRSCMLDILGHKLYDEWKIVELNGETNMPADVYTLSEGKDNKLKKELIPIEQKRQGVSENSQEGGEHLC